MLSSVIVTRPLFSTFESGLERATVVLSARVRTTFPSFSSTLTTAILAIAATILSSRVLSAAVRVAIAASKSATLPSTLPSTASSLVTRFATVVFVVERACSAAARRVARSLIPLTSALRAASIAVTLSSSFWISFLRPESS